MYCVCDFLCIQLVLCFRFSKIEGISDSVVKVLGLGILCTRMSVWMGPQPLESGNQSVNCSELSFGKMSAFLFLFPSRREEPTWEMDTSDFHDGNPVPTVPRKEVIQPHLPVRLPCYDFTPITDPTLDACLLAVSPAASSVANFRGVTGGVYKTRERIHRGVLTHGY